MDRALHAAERRANARGQVVNYVLQQDIDGDLTVTLQEAQAFARRGVHEPVHGKWGDTPPTPVEEALAIAKAMAATMRADLDHDEAIPLAELMAFARQQVPDGATSGPDFPRPEPAREMRFAALLDADRDGTLTEAEHVARIEPSIALADLNQDGALSASEQKAYEGVVGRVRRDLILLKPRG
jgi:hypothetical protein